MKPIQLLPVVMVLASALAAAEVPLVEFAEGVFYPTDGSASVAIAVADVNKDGKPDLIVGNPASVSVLLGNGDGTFQPAVNYPGGAAFNSVAVADMNRDGKPDIVVGNANGVNVLLGNGDGTFQPSIATTASNSAIVVADVNEDGIPDVVLAATGVSVLLGNGDGTFKAPVVTSTYGPEHLAVADLNHDGKPDVVIVTSDGYIGRKDISHATVGVMFGNGDGTFQQPISYDTGGFNPQEIVIADLSGDGSPDILVVNQRAKNPYKGEIGYLGNDGQGGFEGPSDLVFPGNAYSLIAADVTGQGRLDLLITRRGGPFLYAIESRHLFFNGTAVVADVNGDGQPDVIAASQCYQGSGCSGGAAEVLLSAGVGSTTTLTSSSNASQVGQAVTFTAQTTSVRGLAPAGVVVTFFDGSSQLGTAVTGSYGSVSFTTSSLTAGTHSIKAEFPGCIFVKKSRGSIKQVVNP